MKVIFFGTPEYVLPILEKLYKYHELVGVVTQPPKKSGRDQKITFSAVDTYAHKRKVPIFFEFQDLPQADLGVCAAYGNIIPKSVIDSFKFGILNIHPSLLPKFRGASPVQETIISGEDTTGVTIIKMDEKMDHGPIVTKFKEEVSDEDTTETLRNRLFERSAQVLIDLIPFYTTGKINIKEQNHDEATFTKIVSREDGYVDLKSDDPEIISRKLRAYVPWPGVWTRFDGKRLKILSAKHDEGKLELDEVQLEGKNPVKWKQFKEAYPQFK